MDLYTGLTQSGTELNVGRFDSEIQEDNIFNRNGADMTDKRVNCSSCSLNPKFMMMKSEEKQPTVS